MAANKRGAHLALSLERLAALCGDDLVRIGLSATQNPIAAIAQLLVGSAGLVSLICLFEHLVDGGGEAFVRQILRRYRRMHPGKDHECEY